MEERRKHFRLKRNLPLDIDLPHSNGKRVRRISSDISAGGIYFHCGLNDDLAPDQTINLRVAVPPAVGRISGDCSLSGRATVLRVDPMPDKKGIACRFDQPLRVRQDV